MSDDQGGPCLRGSGGSAPTTLCTPRMPISASKSNRRAGRTTILGSASVMHHGGRSSDKKPESNFASVMMRESLTGVHALTAWSLYAVAYQFSTVVIAVLRLLLLTVAFVFTLGGQEAQIAPPGICQVGQGAAMGTSDGSVVQAGSVGTSSKSENLCVGSPEKSQSVPVQPQLMQRSCAA